jgi:hypothetical protein
VSLLDRLNASLIATMPKHTGCVTDPRYVPESHRPAYLKLWGEWLRTHPKTDWEPWMHNLVAEMRAGRAK